MTKLVKLFANDESGATAIEYALLVAIMGVGTVGALDTLEDATSGALGAGEADLIAGAS